MLLKLLTPIKHPDKSTHHAYFKKLSNSAVITTMEGKEFGIIDFMVRNNRLRITRISCEYHQENLHALLEVAVKVSLEINCQGRVEISAEAIPRANSFLKALYQEGFRVPAETDISSRYGLNGEQLQQAVEDYCQSRDEYDRAEVREKLLENTFLYNQVIGYVQKKIKKESINIDTVIDNLEVSDFFIYGHLAKKLERLCDSDTAEAGKIDTSAIQTLYLPDDTLQTLLAEWRNIERLEVSKQEETLDFNWRPSFRRDSTNRFEQIRKKNDYKHPLLEHAQKPSAPVPHLPYNFILEQLTSLLKYPNEERYRIIVDGRLHKDESGWLEYARREEGCLSAAFNALAIAVSDLERPEVTLELILKIYKAFTHKVKLENHYQVTENDEQNIFRPVDFAPSFGLSPEWVTPKGILELLTLIERQDDYGVEEGNVLLPATIKAGFSLFGKFTHPQPNYKNAIHAKSLSTIREIYGVKDNTELATIIYTQIASGNCLWFCMAPCGENYIRKTIDSINQFNSSISKVTEKEAKLELIVGFVYDLDHSHLFKDANVRTYIIGLMNRLLLQHGFVVATFKDPNIFDGHSKKELVICVQQAMALTEEIMAGRKEIFDFRTSCIPEKHQAEYLAMTGPFNDALNKEILRIKELLALQQEEASFEHRRLANP